jgi:PPOX class probable F420-dependent enzyme
VGVNQRHLIRMSRHEVDEFLANSRTLSMATFSPDGTIHLVAMWYGFLEGSVAVETKAKSQKVQNLKRDPRITVMVESGDRYEELKGVELVGQAEIVEDSERIWDLGVSVFERYQGPYSEEMAPFVEQMLNKRVVIKVLPSKVVSWDHSKLGAGATPAPT